MLKIKFAKTIGDTFIKTPDGKFTSVKFIESVEAANEAADLDFMEFINGAWN